MLTSRRKFYLSGSDWAINTVDYMMKSVIGTGNVCQLVLLLDGCIDEQILRNSLNLFVKKFPLLQGRVARDFKLTPYWKIPASMKRDINLKVSHIREADESEGFFAKLIENADSSFLYNKEYIDFHLFISSGRSALAMRFDHRLLDGRGAESFLNLFQKSLYDQSISGNINFVSSMELTEWKSKFQAGKNVNRALIALSQSTPQSLSVKTLPGKKFRYRLLGFDKAETAAIYEKAYRKAGYLMESPFFLAVITQSMHELFQSRNCFDGSCYLIPATVDTRPGNNPLQEIFFNHVSYLFYQIPVEQAADMKALVTLLKQQMYEQVKSGLPADMNEASLLARILPLSLYGKLMHLPAKGKIASFAFSHLGKSSYQDKQFMETPIENIFHMPRVPLPPGIGFFSNLCDGRLNLVISCVDGIITDSELDALEAAIRSKIGILPDDSCSKSETTGRQ